MNLKRILGIAGAITAAIAAIPPVVGIFKQDATPAISIIGNSGPVNTGSGTSIIDRSTKTFASNYFNNWTKGYNIITRQPPPIVSPPSSTRDSLPASSSSQIHGTDKSPDQRSPQSTASIVDKGTTPLPKEENNNYAGSDSMWPTCVLACVSSDRNSCVVQYRNGTMLPLKGLTYLEECSSVFLIQGDIEAVAWTPAGERFKSASPETRIAPPTSISRANQKILTDECIFSSDPCGKVVPHKKADAEKTAADDSQTSDYESVTDSNDRREFEDQDLGMIAALLRKGYYWDAAHFRQLQRY